MKHRPKIKDCNCRTCVRFTLKNEKLRYSLWLVLIVAGTFFVNLFLKNK